MPAPSPALRPARWETWFALFLFVAAAGWFGWAVTRGWHNGNLPGCEFRQAQTAVSAYWIQQDAEFALAYPTPVLGKPWSIPMEYPLYQWTVVTLHVASGLPLVQAGRAVSLVCFLLALPAAYLLGRRLGLDPARGLLLVALLLTCPLHIFYARAFLIETMALMASLWFLLGFVETLRTRRWSWLLLASLAGAAAGTVKVTTFILYLIPAAAWGGWCLLRAWRGRADSRRPIAGVLGWGLGCVVIPFLATVAWTEFADGVKSLNPNGAFLASASMTGFNFGLGDFNLRFSAEAWTAMLQVWHRGILPLPVIAIVLTLAAIWGGRWRWAALGCTALFLLAQIIFPLLYAWHEYYFVANATLLLAAGGFMLAGLWESRLPRWLVLPICLALPALHISGYTQHYLPTQALVSPGGTGLTNIIGELTFPGEVLVIAGEDWDSSTPFYARRRALMIRRNTETDWATIETAFTELHDECVSALLLTGDQRKNTELLARAARMLGIDPRPVFEYNDTTVYLHRSIVGDISTDLRLENYAGVRWHPTLVGSVAKRSLTGSEIATAELHERERLIFSMMKPEPTRFFSQFGAGTSPLAGRRIFNANPLTRLWFRIPSEATTFTAEFGMMPGAYSNPQAASDGAELRVSEVRSDGSLRQLFSRIINPRDNPDDRGTLRAVFPLELQAEAEIVVEILPGPANNGAYDWVYLAQVELR